MSVAETFQMLADPQRRSILLLLKDGRRSAGELSRLLGVSPAKLSYHLKLLRQAEMVSEYREKNFVYYELNTTVFQQMILWMQQFGGERDEKASGCGNDTALSADGGGHELPAGAGADAL